MKVKVGKYIVPVKTSKAAIVHFSSGAQGKSESGDYSFWAAVIKGSRGKKAIFGRARVGLDAGDRFDRMQYEQKTARSKADRVAYSNMWKMLGEGKNIEYIRPVTTAELLRWIITHQSDFRFADSIDMDGVRKSSQ